MVLGEAVPRDESEAVTVPLDVPWATGAAARSSMSVRRGFIGTIAMWERPGQGYEPGTRVSAVIRSWDGDNAFVDYVPRPI